MIIWSCCCATVSARGDGGPWHRKLPGRLDSPAVMLRGQLIWAITHDMTSRIRLLAEHGVDLASPLERCAGTVQRR